MKEAEKLIRSLNIDNDEIIIGVSSGPDSMCLLDILLKNNYKPIVAHINYHKRTESDTEERYLKEYCKINNIIFENKDYASEGKVNFQQDARNFRYDFFRELANKYKTKYIMTAHHGDDLVETILMRLSRGSIFSGYIGFKEISIEKDYIIVRPLIKYSKEDIINYNQVNKIRYFVDKSNYKNDYTRNKYRNKIIPILKEENKNVLSKYYVFSKMIAEYDEYFNEEAEINIKKVFGSYLNIKKFVVLDSLIQKRIVEIILKELYYNKINLVTKKNLEDILKLTKNNQPNKIISLPNQLIVRKSYDKLFFEFEKKTSSDYKYILDKMIRFNNHEVIRLSKIKKNNTNDYLSINSKEIKLPFIIRNRKLGDKIILKDLGTKKLKDILIDKKIDIERRKILPVVTDSNNVILWIPGIQKSAYDINKDYDIILEYIKERK